MLKQFYGDRHNSLLKMTELFLINNVIKGELKGHVEL